MYFLANSDSQNMGSRNLCGSDCFPTWLAVALFHPDVAVVLRHTSLRVQEGHANAAFGTETGIVAATVFDSLLIELVTEPEHRQTDRQRTWKVNSQMNQAHYHLLLH